jgi:hypothetical protein
LLIIQGAIWFEHIKFTNKNEFIILHVSRKSVYGQRKGKTLFLKTNHPLTSWLEMTQIENYRVGEQLNFIK